MAQLMSRLRAVVSSIGNEGALANVLSEMGRAAAARHAVEQLEVRMAIAVEPHRPQAVA
jgi:hypothetical protein